MEYNTRYTLNVKLYNKTLIPNCNHKILSAAKFCPECGKQVGYKNTLDDFYRYIENSEDELYVLILALIDSSINMKWYNYMPDMKTVSSKFPQILFTLYGEGEEPDDLWVCYFLNGMYQKAFAKISYEAFDISRLTA